MGHRHHAESEPYRTPPVDQWVPRPRAILACVCALLANAPSHHQANIPILFVRPDQIRARPAILYRAKIVWLIQRLRGRLDNAARAAAPAANRIATPHSLASSDSLLALHRPWQIEIDVPVMFRCRKPEHSPREYFPRAS